MGHQLAGLALGPLLYLQGRRVRRDTPRLPEPAGARRGEVGAGPTLRVLIVGDSAGAGVGAATQDEALAGRLAAALAPRHRVTWRLLARTGATTARTTARLAREPAADWDVVVTSLGVNDVVAGVPVGRWLVQQEQLVATLTDRFRPRLIILTGVPPMHAFPALPQPLRWYLGRQARRCERALARWAAGRPGVVHLASDFIVDPGLMAPDGFHPGPRIYAAWAEQVAAIIRRADQP